MNYKWIQLFACNKGKYWEIILLKNGLFVGIIYFEEEKDGIWYLSLFLSVKNYIFITEISAQTSDC